MHALLIFACVTPAWAQHSVTTLDDGSVAVVIEGDRYDIPASVAQSIISSIAEHADDPEALRNAVRAIIAKTAADSESVGLATAIAVFAISQAEGSSSLINAIALGVTQENTSISGGTLIAAIPALQSERPPEEQFQQEVARSQATAENPAQVSTVTN